MSWITGKKVKRRRILPLFHPVTLFSNSILAPELETVCVLVTLVQESCFRLDQDVGADPRIEDLELSKAQRLYVG